MASYTRYMEDDEGKAPPVTYAIDRARYSRAGELPFSSSSSGKKNSSFTLSKRNSAQSIRALGMDAAAAGASPPRGAVNGGHYHYSADEASASAAAHSSVNANWFSSPSSNSQQQEKRLPSPFEAYRYTDPRRRTASSARAPSSATLSRSGAGVMHFLLHSPLPSATAGAGETLNATHLGTSTHEHERTIGTLSAVGSSTRGEERKNEYFLHEQNSSSKGVAAAAMAEDAVVEKGGSARATGYIFPYDYSPIPLGQKKADRATRVVGTRDAFRNTTHESIYAGRGDDADREGYHRERREEDTNNWSDVQRAADEVEKEVTLAAANSNNNDNNNNNNNNNSADKALQRLKNIASASRSDQQTETHFMMRKMKAENGYDVDLNTTPATQKTSIVRERTEATIGEQLQQKTAQHGDHHISSAVMIDYSNNISKTTKISPFSPPSLSSVVAEKAPFAAHYAKTSVMYDSLQPTEAVELMDRYGYHYEAGTMAKQRAEALEATVLRERRRRDRFYAQTLLDQIDEKKRRDAFEKDQKHWEDSTTAPSLLGIGNDAETRMLQSRQRRKALEEEWLREAAAKKERDAAERALLKPWEEDWNILEARRERDMSELNEQERKKLEEEIRLENWKLEQERRAEEQRFIEEERKRIEELTLSENVANYAERIVLAEELKRAEQRKYKEELDRQIREKHLQKRRLAAEQYELECRLGSY